jgi:GNAT superfamily N-acetyltransferase
MASAALSSASALASAAARAGAGAGSSSVLRTVTLLRPEHADAAVRCVAASFAAPPARQAAAAAAAGGRLDPFTAAFNFKRASWARLSGPFVARAAAAPAPLSVVAYNRGSGEVDGVICVDDYLKQPPALYRGLPAEWAPTRAIFRELYTRFDATPLAPRAERSTLQCLYFSCVRPQARGAGVMKQLYRHTIEAARDRGFESIVASAAHPDVQRTLRDALGFEEVAAVDFAAFAQETGLDGFASLPPGYEKLALMRRKLPSDLYV